MKYQENKIKIVQTFAAQIDSISSGTATTEITTQTVVNGILGSSSGAGEDYLYHAIRYMRQKDGERQPKLTKQYLSDLRDAMVVRVEDDNKQWDQDLRDMLKTLMILGRNVNMSFKNAREDGKPDGAEGEAVDTGKEKGQKKSDKYNFT